ncbi:unnamed protein product [Rotaria sordida]|uniref:Uncharacterized protein n=1 Tax=Rotaria sordida TaxID=392033 RepID=A0A814JEX6_9BILA|nr:unnamed protein product [Rotaria sordida]CAF1060324.1 unnamed protein product [Rotaria sordida]
MVDVLYSLVDVNQRFDKLLLDPLYIRNLDMTSMTMKSCFDLVYSIENKVLSRISKNILPRIHHQVNELTLEQDSMEHILHRIHYPRLYSLSLIDFQEVLIKYLTVDGRLNCLSTLKIYVDNIAYTSATIDSTKKLPKLKHFTLCSYARTVAYDNRIVRLLRRMINLEELILFLSIIRTDSNYIDGIQLYDSILIYMARLNKFTFSIDTNQANRNHISSIRNQDILQLIQYINI